MKKKGKCVVQVYVAAFSISGYAWASWRYRNKPFNPVLGETYESHREDRGFHYVSEQVRSGAASGRSGKSRWMDGWTKVQFRVHSPI